MKIKEPEAKIKGGLITDRTSLIEQTIEQFIYCESGLFTTDSPIRHFPWFGTIRSYATPHKTENGPVGETGPVRGS